MTFSLRTRRILQIGLPLGVLAVCSILVMSPIFSRNSSGLSTAVTLDLVISAPLLFWLAGGRRRAVVRVFVLGLLAAGLLLHGRSHPLVDQLRRWVSPAVEVWVIYLLVRGIYRARRARVGGEIGAGAGDFLIEGRRILGEALGSERMGDVLMSEFAVFYYLFFARMRKGEGFSYHRRNGIRSILYVFVFCMVAETVGLHFLAGMASKLLAWVLTGLGGYTLLQLLGHCRAIRLRPVVVSGGRLYLRNGLVADATVGLEDIGEVRKLGRGEVSEGVRLGLLGAFEAPNVKLTLRRPVTVFRPFGVRREAAVLLFYVDEPEEFIRAIGTCSKIWR